MCHCLQGFASLDTEVAWMFPGAGKGFGLGGSDVGGLLIFFCLATAWYRVQGSFFLGFALV